ncbi:hypothetical protein [Alicyclobacillus fastidiosus]|uniref:Uncharacterized protein n=1 Tax=Alicyclobacillus fastidiosus TaxID=392011 RepID=A0ABV5AA20_9BACL|nr:hypothetical protein [Alicyclobacillus fastidiosus]WEH10959.1 hypothetical protein PYS47_07010 [Alicyclobacillus fastidiosus]
MDLREIVLNSFDEIAKDGFIEAQVKKTLESTIKETVQDIFRSYSDFGKSLKKHVEEQLAI